MDRALETSTAGGRASFPAAVLTGIILVLAVLASAGGMLRPAIYHDNDFVKLAWEVNDAVTLFVAVPLLGLFFILAMLGSLRSQLLWAGMLGFMIYNYAYYLFGAAFNSHFLLYVGLFFLPIMALIALLSRLDMPAIRATYPHPLLARGVAIYMLLWGLMLGVMWSMQAIDMITSGTRPEILETTGGGVHLIAAMDMTCVVPFYLLAGWWLWRGNPWGVVVGVISNLKGAVYCMVLAWGAHAGDKAGYSGGELLPLWITVCLLSAASVAALVWRPGEQRPRPVIG